MLTAPQVDGGVNAVPVDAARMAAAVVTTEDAVALGVHSYLDQCWEPVAKALRVAVAKQAALWGGRGFAAFRPSLTPLNKQAALGSQNDLQRIFKRPSNAQ